MLLYWCLPIPRTVQKASTEASGEVTSRDLISPMSLPGFDRAAMDGFAVRSADTRGARPFAPVLLEGFQPLRTGMEVPEEYDAVVMLEDARLCNAALEVSAEVHAYKNISRIGEDIRQGDVVFREGRSRPPDVALLSALGIGQVSVYARPKIVIIPTGGELVPIGSRNLRTGEAYEINGLMAVCM